MKILFFEDKTYKDPDISTLINMKGNSVDIVQNQEQLEELLPVQAYDLILLDLSSSNDKKSTVISCKKAKSKPHILVSILKKNLLELETLINLGVDDYITRPFNSLEFKMRLNTIARKIMINGLNEFKLGNIKYNIVSGDILIHDHNLNISRRELGILKILIKNNQRMITTEEIYEKLFSIDDDVEQSTIRVYISRLRTKLSGSGLQIKSVRGLGYILKEECR